MLVIARAWLWLRTHPWGVVAILLALGAMAALALAAWRYRELYAAAVAALGMAEAARRRAAAGREAAEDRTDDVREDAAEHQARIDAIEDSRRERDRRTDETLAERGDDPEGWL